MNPSGSHVWILSRLHHLRRAVAGLANWLLSGVVVLCLGVVSIAPSAYADDKPVSFRVLWQARIGSYSGSPVVYRGKVLIGTNNSAPRDPRLRDDRGVVMCFDQDKGTFLGQVTHARLSHRAMDMPGLGICCRPSVEGNRTYYVSNRGELVCLNLDAFDRGAVKQPEALIRWKVDMVQELGVFKRDAGDLGNPLSSPVIIGDLVFCVTGNGAAFGSAANALPAGTPYVPKATAPSFVAVNKTTGKVAWSSSAPGKCILYGQWASPERATVAGVDQVLFPGGDGWLYGFKARTGRMVWKIDCNDSSATPWGPDQAGTRSSFMAAPVVRGNLAYIGAAVDLERTDLRRPLYAVDLTQQGELPRKAIRWAFWDKDFGGTFGRVALGKDTLYSLGDSGVLVCLNPTTGKEFWRANLREEAKRFGSPCVHGGRVLVPVGSKLFWFEDGRKRKPLGEYEFDEEIMGTPAIFQDRIYLATRKYLYCLRMRTDNAS